MRTIYKNAEPYSLTEHRQKSYSDYDNYADKDSLRQSLVAEQCGLCCYCQSRIRPDAGSMKIEHWQCRDNFSKRQLDYGNLLGACLGGEGCPASQQHCDTRKGKKELLFCPADPTHKIEERINFLGDGRIKSSDTEFDRELNEVLNLNWERIVKNRKAVLKAFQQRIATGKKLDPKKELPKWDGSQGMELPEYSKVVVYYLNKKLRRAAK